MIDLIAMAGDKVLGRLASDRPDRASLVYDADWLGDPAAVPLSSSLPLSAGLQEEGALTAVLWGLLPDDERALQRWSSRFHVSTRDVLGMLSNVGEDCAGAVQFVRPERVYAFRQGDEDGVRWLDDNVLASRLSRLRHDSGAMRESDDRGQCCLAGAQAKTAFH